MRSRGLRARLGALVLALALLPLAGAGQASSETPDEIRVWAIGYKHLVSDGYSSDDYRAHLAALAATADPDPEDDTDPRPKLFVFPEDAALYAMFAGARGRAALEAEPLLRNFEGNGAAVAVAALLAAAQPQAAYYRARFPHVNLSQVRAGMLALTDALYRSFHETFREIAIRHGAWVVTSANIAPARVTTDPAVVAALVAPEDLGRPCATAPAPCAYEATSPNVYNQAFVYDPDGNLVLSDWEPAREGPLDGAVKKTYLVEIEQGPIEEGKLGLDLAYGDMRQVLPVEIAGVKMGIVISKPAWMLDELGRLEAYDTEVMLQPEAFGSWGAPVADWSPDVLKQSGWSHTQRYGPFRYSVMPELTGNFFDLIFDAQNHIVEKATDKSAVARGYIGQPDDVGWVAVSLWATGDAPGEECDRPALLARRECLAEWGRALAPGSADERENAYPEPLIASVLSLAPPAPDPVRAPGALGTNIALDPYPSRQRNPSIAAGPDGTYVAWEDGRDGIRLARVGLDGAPTGTRTIPFPGALFPQVAVASDGALHVVWQHTIAGFGSWIVRTSAPAWDEPFGQMHGFGGLIPGYIRDQWKPAIALTDDGTLHATFIGRWSDDLISTIYARVPATGETIYSILDPPAPATNPYASELRNRWNPSIAVRGDTVAVAWTDFRDYAWDMYAAVSHDGGETFGEHLRVDDASRVGDVWLERLHNDPSILIAPDGTIEVAWTDQAGRRAGCETCAHERRPDADIAFAALAPGETDFSWNARVDDTGDGLQTEDRVGFSNQWRPVLARAGNVLVAVWQDHREGNNDIYLASSADGGRTWGANLRVDDTGSGHSNQIAPAAVVDASGALVVVWQDDRDGIDRIYLARGSL